MPRKRRVVKHSRGELLCGSVLRELADGGVTPQFPLGRYFYDYMFVYRGRPCLLEYDGIQHFQYVPFIHRREANFRSRFQRDVDKSATGLLAGYTVIRLDYHIDTTEEMRRHLLAALALPKRLYCSSTELYAPLLRCSVSPKLLDIRTLKFST